jgi:predicted HTH domain antitoxin
MALWFIGISSRLWIILWHASVSLGGPVKPLSVLPFSDLAQKSEDLLSCAREGGLSVIVTEEGRPVILALPFDLRLLEHGVQRATALHLLESGVITSGQGARLAGISLEEFIEIAGKAGITMVDYPPGELEKEVEAALGTTPPPSK